MEDLLEQHLSEVQEDHQIKVGGREGGREGGPPGQGGGGGGGEEGREDHQVKVHVGGKGGECECVCGLQVCV